MGLSAVSGVERAGALNYNENETLPHEVGEEKAEEREERSLLMSGFIAVISSRGVTPSRMNASSSL